MWISGGYLGDPFRGSLFSGADSRSVYWLLPGASSSFSPSIFFPLLFPTEDCSNVQCVASQGTAGWQGGKYQVLTLSGALGTSQNLLLFLLWERAGRAEEELHGG